jgi:hypothetical protein
MWGKEEKLILTKYVPFSKLFNADRICEEEQAVNSDTICALKQEVKCWHNMCFTADR